MSKAGVWVGFIVNKWTHMSCGYANSGFNRYHLCSQMHQHVTGELTYAITEINYSNVL
jgi:hypothetical protein